jgi:Flp pilus assembly protein TadG
MHDLAPHTPSTPKRHGPRKNARARLRAARERLCAQDGQALVEFALVLPILLALVLGIVEFALALNAQGDETHIASEIARYATVDQNPGQAERKTLAQWGAGQLDNKALQEGKSKLCIKIPNNEAGQPVTVEFKSTVHWLPIPKLSVATTPLVGSAVMRLETAVAPTNIKTPEDCAEE